jgi:hypothetical protein
MQSPTRSADQTLPEVMGWDLACLTAEEVLFKDQQEEIQAIMAAIRAETDAAIAAEEATVHETCPTCNHTKTYMKDANDTKSTAPQTEPKTGPKKQRTDEHSGKTSLPSSPVKKKQRTERSGQTPPSPQVGYRPAWGGWNTRPGGYQPC